MTDKKKTTKAEDKKPYIHHSSSQYRALFKGFREIPTTGTIVCKLSLMSGKDEDGNQRYLNGSFFVSKSVKYFAERLLSSDFDVDGKAIVADVEISDLDCNVEPNSKDPEKPYKNYRGFLNKIIIG